MGRRRSYQDRVIGKIGCGMAQEFKSARSDRLIQRPILFMWHLSVDQKNKFQTFKFRRTLSIHSHSRCTTSWHLGRYLKLERKIDEMVNQIFQAIMEYNRTTLSIIIKRPFKTIHALLFEFWSNIKNRIKNKPEYFNKSCNGSSYPGYAQGFPGSPFHKMSWTFKFSSIYYFFIVYLNFDR